MVSPPGSIQPSTRLRSLKDLQAEWSVSLQTLRRLMASGQLVPLRIGRRVLFTPEAIQAFLESRRQAAK